MKNGLCIKCNGNRVSRLNTFDGNDAGGTELRLAHYQNPESWFFKGSTFFHMEAFACFDCGYVEFYMKPGEENNAAFGR